MLEVILYIALTVLLGLNVVVAARLAKSYRLFKAPKRVSNLGQDVDLPSVTVCIPARNEQHALTDCIERVLASTYQKLEIIVFDDVSGDDTSALIKSFASEGVRFIQGKDLPEGWLGKNHALSELLGEASGTYVLFMDVDTRLSPDAIENMVRYALSTSATMVSVLPRREDGWRFSVVASPLRYYWELILHRKLWPAAASSTWMIRRKVLKEHFSGFEQYKDDVQPEVKIATKLAESGQYRFIVSGADFGVSIEKKWRSQLLTSIRLLFPLLGKDIAVTILVLADLLLLLMPFAILIWLILTLFGASPLTSLTISGSMTFVYIYASVNALMSIILYSSYTRRVWRRGWWVGALLWPLLLIQELVLVVVSVVQYKRRTINWKGRTILREAQN